MDDIEWIGDQVYVAIGSKIGLFDLESPASLNGAMPVLRFEEPDQRYWGLVRDESHLYLLSAVTVSDGVVLRVLDVSDPRAPELVGEMRRDDRWEAMYLMDMHVDDDHAIALGCMPMLGHGASIVTLDITQPENPRVLAEVKSQMPDESSGIRCGAMTMIGPGSALLTSPSESRLFDVSDPGDPEILAELALSGTAIASSETRLWIANETGLASYDVSNPEQLVKEWHLDGYGSHHLGHMALHESMLFHPGDGRLSILDIEGRDRPPVVGKHDFLAGWIKHVAGGAGRLATAAANVIFVLDVSDPREPRQLRRLAGFDTIADIGWWADRLVVSDSTGLYLMSQEHSTSREATIKLWSGRGGRLAVEGERLYVDAAGDLLVFEFSDSGRAPREIARIEAVNQVSSISIRGSRVALSRKQVQFGDIPLSKPGDPPGIRVYDLTDLDAPRVLLEQDYTHRNSDLLLDRGMLLASQFRVMRIFDLDQTSTETPALEIDHDRLESVIGNVDLDLAWLRLARSERFHLAYGSGGLGLFELTSSSTLRWLDGVDLPPYEFEDAVVDTANELLLMAAGEAGLVIVRFDIAWQAATETPPSPCPPPRLRCTPGPLSTSCVGCTPVPTPRCQVCLP